MRLRLRLIDPRSTLGGSLDVLVECVPATRFGAVRAHLDALVSDSSDGFEVDGILVDDDAEVGCPPLIQGAALTARARGFTSGRMAGRPVGLLELHVVGGPGAGRRIPIGRGEHVLGRAPQCAIRLDDAGVSRAHATLTVDDDGVTLRDVEPTNPTTIDGHPAPSPGLRLEVGARVRLASTTLVLRRPSTTPAPITLDAGSLHLHRRPRFVSAASPATVVFPARPTRSERARMPLLASLTPLVLSGALAVALHSPVMLLFALMSPVMLLGQWWSDRRHGRTSFRRQLADHGVAVAAAEHQLRSVVEREEDERRAEHPDLAEVVVVAQLRDSRLWQRTPGDPDDLVLRIGSADLPARAALSGEPTGATPACRDVPVTCDLADAGVVGVAGPRERVLSIAGSMLAQLCVWHSPQRLDVVLLTTSSSPDTDWAWLTRTPHLDGAGRSVASAGTLGDGLSVAARVSELTEQLTVRASARSAHDDGALAALPSVVVVLDGARELRTVAGVVELLRSGPALGIRFICLADSVSGLPAETVSQIEVHASTEARATMTTRRGMVGEGAAIVPDLPTGGWLERVGGSLAPLQDATPRRGHAGLPERLGFRELAAQEDTDPTSATDVARAWTGSGPPRALVGVTREGPYWLDLADQGPHALVGGTTGSGKSEMLQTLVAGLAVSSRPDDLGFVLIDYKGGSAFKECARLPHVVGLVTDLDESLTARALTSLSAELKRRERVLAVSGAKDVDDHRRRHRSDPSLPRLGRLVIVVDEFKMLADELPDFVTGLVQLAAIGRSLGVHLVLATQRPGGIVSADMRANVSLRVALRVRDRSDSDDVIEDPRAATISDRMPGRAFVRTADQRLLEVQFAHVGAAIETERQGGTETRVWPLRWSDLAEPAPYASSARGAGERTELAAVVDATQEAAASLSLDATTAPWLPPLPPALQVSSLSRVDGGVSIGLRDEPERQSQPVLTWHPGADGHLGIAGGSRTGRSTALRSIVVGLTERHSPTDLHIHVLEGRRGALTDLLPLTHVGSVTSADDAALARRVVSRIVEGTRSNTTSDQRPANTVLVIDGWEAVEDAFADLDHGAPTEELLRLARDGLSAGLRLVVAGGRAVSTGRLSGLLQRRIVLSMPDPLELTLAGIDARRANTPLPPGRGFELPGGQLVQLAHIGVSVDDANQLAAVTSAADLARLRSHDVPLGDLPWQVRALPTCVTPAELHQDGRRLAIGLGGDDATTVHLDPASSGRRLLVAGPARSGRSTTLALLAQQLLAAGRPVALVPGRRSRLRELGGLPGLHLLDSADRDGFVELRRATPELGILVDDAENLSGTPMEAALLEATAIVDSAEGVVVVVAETQRALGLFRGLVPEVARDGCGVLLSPSSPADGDLLRVRVDVPNERRPGFGFVVAEGSCTPVQIADAFASGVRANDGPALTISRA
ncbi:MAG: FHA domain-containing protein [Humibacillus sp.]|nr:FHA domain-containing protein [Humibacillus sp.]MDN5779382.1 FHA domain-containing protein [Humibacillus sp.]